MRSSTRRLRRLLRQGALALAVTAIAAPTAQAVDPAVLGKPTPNDNPWYYTGFAPAAKDNPIGSVPQGWENAQFGPANLPVKSTTITIPAEFQGRQFGPANLPVKTVTIPEGWEDAQFGPANFSPELPAPAQVVSPDGFDFRDAGVGAAMGAAIGLILAAAGLLVTRRRYHPVGV